MRSQRTSTKHDTLLTNISKRCQTSLQELSQGLMLVYEILLTNISDFSYTYSLFPNTIQNYFTKHLQIYLLTNHSQFIHYHSQLISKLSQSYLELSGGYLVGI